MSGSQCTICVGLGPELVYMRQDSAARLAQAQRHANLGPPPRHSAESDEYLPREMRIHG
jgi:hypothetical protein